MSTLMKLNAALLVVALLAGHIAKRISLTAGLRQHAVVPGGRTVVTTTHRRLIRQARAAGMTIHQVAALLGLAVTTVSKYSCDRTQERLDEYQRQRYARRLAKEGRYWMKYRGKAA
jgi:DNA-binding NarL/FixJ family response regulator